MIDLSGLKIYINGEFVPAEKAGISPFDRGLLYGDAVFEGIREYDGKVFRLDEHIDRLFDSARIMDIKIPFKKTELKEIILQTIRENKLRDAHIRPIITRGMGVGVGPELNYKPTIIVLAHPWKPFLGESGITMKTSAIRKIPPVSFDSRAKCTGAYINGIMAKLDLKASNCDEALLLDTQGFVAEGPGENFLIIKKRVLYSPQTTNILNGITRQTIIHLAHKMEIVTCEKNLTLGDIYTCDEAFVCGTGAEVCPVRMVDGRKIGDTIPGPITSSLIKLFKNLINREGTPVY